MEKEILETVLKKNQQSFTVERVLSFNLEDAVPKGVNFMSQMIRIKLVVVLGNGRKSKKSIILKHILKGEAAFNYAIQTSAFKREALMYDVIFKEMGALMNEFDDTIEQFWCDMISYEPYTYLLFEDLKASGFMNVNSKDLLDLEHCMLTLKELGRFHAMSKVLEKNGINIKYSNYHFFCCNDRDSVLQFVYAPVQALKKAMEKDWGPEWEDVAKKLNNVTLELLLELNDRIKDPDNSRFNCINHGDCWCNNIMYKYDWRNRPHTLRFLDFQTMHYNTPAYDITYFLYSSAKPEVRRTNYDVLIDCYLKSLNSTLDFYQYEGMRLSKEDLERAMDDVLFIKLASVAFVSAVATTHKVNAFDLELVLKSGGVEGFDLELYNKGFRDRMGPDLIEIGQTLTSYVK